MEGEEEKSGLIFIARVIVRMCTSASSITHILGIRNQLFDLRVDIPTSIMNYLKRCSLGCLLVVVIPA